MTDQVGVAIIGCGYWGVNYVRVFSESPQARVVTICDQRADRLQEIGRRFPGVRLTTDIDEALRMEGVEAAVICTQAKTHHSIARRCLLAGKHVLIEKPVTTTVADAEDLTDMAELRNLVLMVGHTFIYNSGIRKIRQYVDQGAVGQLYYVYARRTNLGPIRQDVNALWDLAPHDISIFNYLLGAVPEWVSAVGIKVLRNAREDVGFLSLGYPNGIVGHIHVSWADPNKVREVVVVGSEKRIAFNDLNPLEPVRIFEKGAIIMPPEPASYGDQPFLLRDGDIISPRVESSEPLRNQCNHFLECLTEGARPLTSGQAGRDVVRVMEAVDRSIQHNGAPVKLEDQEEHYEYREVGAAHTLR